jgi:hypothetical protein
VFVTILGTQYEIIKKKYDEDEAFDRRSIDGYCDSYAKRIVYCDMTSYRGWEHEPEETAALCEKQTMRHEIVHAFLSECGLADSAFPYDAAWAKNEEMVDWFASVGPKIYVAWQNAGAL